jgi:hypothetical protein
MLWASTLSRTSATTVLSWRELARRKPIADSRFEKTGSTVAMRRL